MYTYTDSAVHSFLFWVFFSAGCLLGLTYLGLVIISVTMSMLLSALVGVIALIAQCYLLRMSFRLNQIRDTQPSRLFLVLIGGSLLVFFVWFGSCFITVTYFA